MSDTNNEQQTVSQAYRDLSEIDRMLYKTIIDLTLILLKRTNVNEQNFEN
ncbi:MAG: hypothetical protein K2H29_07325 [Oscillospiraceae bacterium]|nr:hypothetical protein [Oscillospiraceae bacterium]